MTTNQTVLVTGVTGYIGSQVAIDLLQNGYGVRGSVRDPNRADLDHVRAVAQANGREFETVTASLLDDEGWDAAMDGVSHVAHVASPAPKTAPKDEDELIRPAVEGTVRVLTAASQAGVKRVAVTSSIDAVRSGHDLSDGRPRTENDWADVDKSQAYAKSKTLAERAAWRTADRLEIELVTLLPGLVLGPTGAGRTNVSVELVRLLLTREMPALPHLGFTIVDVRDVAAAHRRALVLPTAAGQRFILANEPTWLPEIAAVLLDEFGPLGYRVPKLRLPSMIVRLGSHFDPRLKSALPYLDVPALVTTSKASADLGWAARPWQDTVRDTGSSLIEHGQVSARAW